MTAEEALLELRFASLVRSSRMADLERVHAERCAR